MAGFDRLVVSDHVVFGENLEAYADPSIGGSRGGRQPTGPDGAWLEPLVTIARLAGGDDESAIRHQHPDRRAEAARGAGQDGVDHRCPLGGRLDLGVGVGSQREEYESAGLPFDTRGRLLDHSLEVCQALWGNRVTEYHSDELAFDRIHQMPKPRQPGGVPVWVSGTVNSRSMDRLARFGQGWIPWGDDAADVMDGIARMRTAIRARNREPETLQVVGTLRPARSDAGGPDFHRGLRRRSPFA